MARRSILSPVRDEQHMSSEPVAQTQIVAPAEIVRVPKAASASSRHAKLHVGGYFDPYDPILVAFQKLKVDLRRVNRNPRHYHVDYRHYHLNQKLPPKNP